jgi:ankyrin repeat protein
MGRIVYRSYISPRIPTAAQKHPPLNNAFIAGLSDEEKNLIEGWIEHGVDVNAPQDDKGSTPLHKAAYEGHAGIAAMLIAYGADVNARDNVGYTPLHWAVYEEHTDIIKILLAHGADVNAHDNDGRIPLDLLGYKDVAEVFLEYGLDQQQKNGWMHELARRQNENSNINEITALLQISDIPRE